MEVRGREAGAPGRAIGGNGERRGWTATGERDTVQFMARTRTEADPETRHEPIGRGVRGLLAALALCAAAVPRGAPAATHVVDGSIAAADDSGPGTSERPWRTIGRAAREAMPGDVALIRTGVYRERVVIERSGTEEKPILFQADGASPVIVTGADVLRGWRREEALASGQGRPARREGANLFSTEWPHSFIDYSPQHTHPGDPAHLLIGRAEQALVQGYPLRQVLGKDELARDLLRGLLRAPRARQRDHRQRAGGHPGELGGGGRDLPLQLARLRH